MASQVSTWWGLRAMPSAASRAAVLRSVRLGACPASYATATAR